MTPNDQLSWRSMAKLTSVGDLATAHVLAARLDHEGIHCQIRGESIGPYPIAVGSWGETEIWVDEADLDEARALLAEIEAEQHSARVERAGVGKSPSIGRSVVWWVVAAAMVAWIVYLWVRRLL